MMFVETVALCRRWRSLAKGKPSPLSILKRQGLERSKAGYRGPAPAMERPQHPSPVLRGSGLRPAHLRMRVDWCVAWLAADRRPCGRRAIGMPCGAEWCRAESGLPFCSPGRQAATPLPLILMRAAGASKDEATTGGSGNGRALPNGW